MKFNRFIERLHSTNSQDVPFNESLRVINECHEGIGDIRVWAIPFDSDRRDAFFRRVELERTSVYGNEFWNVEIRYSDTLDDHPRERRWALTKELMHVFDGSDAWASSREAFKRLIRDIQNEPLPTAQSPAYRADLATRWKALIALCPLDQRNKLAKGYEDGVIEDYEIASVFGVPLWLASVIVDPMFIEARTQLMENGM